MKIDKEYHRKWREANPEKAKEYYQQYGKKPEYIARQKEWYLANRERISKLRKLRYEKNKEKERAYQKTRTKLYAEKQWEQGIRRNYGLDATAYNALLSKQGFCCAICKKQATSCKKRLSVDHCHATKVIRGLLCENCNRGIGHLKDSELIMLEAIAYLKAPR
jgi:hypothetical protein